VPLVIDLSGKIALVTGAGTGIGVGIAESLAEAGADVAVSYHDSGAGAHELAASLTARGRRSNAFAADLRKVEDAEHLVDAVLDTLGPIDILVNNAGLTDPHPPLELTEAEWDRTLDINVKGMFFLAQRVGREMIERGIKGSIINLSSGQSIRVVPDHVHYAASKAAINHMTRSLARHLAPNGIRVNAIAPGAVEVERYYRTRPGYSREDLAATIPLGRVGFPADIGPTAAFLASDLASWLTGQIVYVDGGGTLIRDI
jgi:glucose 1-dehydrogenase/3-oxoacyl-[acyl-carrier protein] reductase